MTKFTVLPIAINKTMPITIDNNIVQYAEKATILGLTINSRGYTKQITINKNKPQRALYTIKRFSHLNTNIKLHLIKTCVIPILTYPPYPLASLSKTSIKKLQKIQNNSLRYVYNEKYPFNRTMEELHTLSNIKPINIVIHEQARKTKSTMQNNIQDETYIQFVTENQDNQKEHSWFPKTALRLDRHNPTPNYT